MKGAVEALNRQGRKKYSHCFKGLSWARQIALIYLSYQRNLSYYYTIIIVNLSSVALSSYHCHSTEGKTSSERLS